jgi:Flp pilus assembly protein TadD
MSLDSFSPKTKALIIGGTMALLVVFVIGSISSYELLTHRDTLYIYLFRFAAKKTEFAAKARLPDDMRGVAQEAADHFSKREYDEAAACYQQIINKYPESLYAWSNLGVVRFQQNKFDEAKMALLQSVALSPNDAFSWSNLGITNYQLEDYDEAMAALEKAVALDPNDAKSHNYLGCCCSKKGDQKRAEEEFQKAIEIDRKFGDAYFNLALVFATANPPDVEQAKINYQQAVDLGIAKDPRLEKIISKNDETK